MLAETREEPFSRAGWVFELKLDGYRMRASREDGDRATHHPQRQRLQRRRSPS